MKRQLIQVLSNLVHVVTLGQMKYSRATEGNALSMKLGDKVWWAYKFYSHPIFEPEKGKGIREYFKAHPISGFAEASFDGVDPSDSKAADRATITFAGDILPATSVRADNTTHFWDDVSEFYLNADLRYANLESPVAKGVPIIIATEDMTSAPHMNNSADTVSLFTLEGKGINIFSTANNHALDHGIDGLINTLDFLDEAGLPHVGTARNQEEKDLFPILEVNGIKVAFISWTYSLNNQTTPEGQDYLANVLRLNIPGIDISPIALQARQARERGADVVVACLHWGLEYECFPLSSQIETGHRIIEAGVDIIAGNHPHGSQPTERYCYRDADGNERAGLIMYALSNLVDEFPKEGLSALGAFVRVQLIRLPNAQVVIRSAEHRPFFAYHYPSYKEPTDIRVLDFIKLKQRLQAGDLDSDPRLGPEQIAMIKRLIPVQEDLLPVDK